MNQTSSQLKTLKRTASLDLSKWYMGILLTNLVEKKDTDGAFFLLEATLLPGNEPPPHVHTREDELFCVLEGEFDVYVGEGALEVKNGRMHLASQIQAARICHSFPRLRVLILYTPEGVEEAFRRMSSPAQNLDPPTQARTFSMSDLAQTARRFREFGDTNLGPGRSCGATAPVP